MKKKSSIKNLKYFLLFFIGLILGIGVIWPGIFSGKGRECFLKIIKDGSDGDVKFSTILSISPNYLMKIKNANNIYIKVLLIGDYCYRKF
tara:strand:+ start:352 stop:621 length:270 start_codon:yes stop_codon:yes gene_type:complete